MVYLVPSFKIHTEQTHLLREGASSSDISSSSSSSSSSEESATRFRLGEGRGLFFWGSLNLSGYRMVGLGGGDKKIWEVFYWLWSESAYYCILMACTCISHCRWCTWGRKGMRVGRCLWSHDQWSAPSSRELYTLSGSSSDGPLKRNVQVLVFPNLAVRLIQDYYEIFKNIIKIPLLSNTVKFLAENSSCKSIKLLI